MEVLVIKLGALGDVVRTSYILPGLRKKGAMIDWVTADAAVPLLEHHPDLRSLIPWSAARREKETGAWAQRRYDWVIALDDEMEACRLCDGLNFAKLTGAQIKPDGSVGYTEDSAEWFDMGLVSKWGKARADDLKMNNRRTHDEIFSAMLDLPPLEPGLFLAADSMEAARTVLAEVGRPWLGLNLSAGKRWPSKRLLSHEGVELVMALQQRGVNMVLLGARDDAPYLQEIQAATDCRTLPECSLDVFAAVIGQLKAIVTSDSLALHLAVAQRVPSVSFYAPTSAAEINLFGCGEKVVSTAPDYCCYRPDADNSSITAERLLVALDRLGCLD